MKKVLFCLVAVLVLFSCKKNTPDPSTPSISWEANAGFAVQEMGDSMDGAVTVSCSAGIGSLQIKGTVLPNLSKVYVSQWIGIQAYKSTFTMDLINDPLLADAFASNQIASPIGNSLIRATSCTIDFKALLDAITKGLPLDNGTRFAFEIVVSNTSGTEVSKTASFRWTAAATFPSNAPSIYWLQPNDTKTLKLSITVPGKVSEFTISFQGDEADEGILTFIRKKSASKTTVIDMVNDNNVQQAFHMDPVIKNAAQVDLDLSDLMQDLGYECGNQSKTQMVISAKDALGKVGSHTITLIPLTAAEE